MNGLQRLLVGAVLIGIASCEQSEPAKEVSAPVSPSSPRFESGSVAAAPLPRSQIVFSDPEPIEPDHEAETAAIDSGSEIAYSKGDNFEGMWHHNRRSATLRLTIESVDPKTRTLEATMKSADLDGPGKQFKGSIGRDGRQLVLTGIPGTGGDFELVSGYDVRDFLRKTSAMKINLDDCNARQLRGTDENGASIYFWSKVRRK